MSIRDLVLVLSPGPIVPAICLGLLCIGLFPRPLPAQLDAGGDAIDYAAIRAERIVSAVRIDEDITLDGRLDEHAWGKASPAADFIQWQPNPGAPGSERTEARFLYDDNNIYVGIFCYDSEPHRLIVHELKKDYSGQDSDQVALVLDSVYDKRSGFIFATNPAGAKRDFQVANDGAITSIDWDGEWEVETTTNEEGWVAEFVIPFKTVRFSKAKNQVWGMNIQRRIRRKNEDSYWAPMAWPYRGNKMSMAGTLVGLEDIRQGRNLKVKPFVIAGMRQTRSGHDFLADSDFDGGLDLKYGITSQLTLDLSYRTDFAQVEVDQQQLNLTRFNLFFREKREFFLENSGTFTFGQPIALFSASGSGGSRPNNLIPFFSRRIGLDRDGLPIPILGGARVSGTVGTYDVGFLTMKTESRDKTPSNTFTVGRVKKNILHNSWLGAMVTSRNSSRTNDYNRVYGVDARFQFFEKLELGSYLMRSDTPGLSGDAHAQQIQGGWRGETFSAGGLYHHVGKNFNPEVGFIRRRDTTLYSGSASWRPRLASAPQIRNIGLGIAHDYYTAGGGEIVTRESKLNAGVFFHNSAAISFEMSETFERLAKPFRINLDMSIPAGDHHFQGYSASFNSNKSRVVSGNVRMNWGSFWNGSRTSVKGGVALRPNYHVNIDLDYTRNEVTLPQGSFASNLIGTRFLYAFTSKVFLNAFLQYNTDSNRFSSNIRFNIIHHALSDFFVVYTDIRDTVSGQLVDRALIVKFTQLLSF